MLGMKAETAAEMYIGVEDTGKFLRFLDFYVSLYETESVHFRSLRRQNCQILWFVWRGCKEIGEFWW